MLDIINIKCYQGTAMKKQLIPVIAATLVLGGLAIWALRDLVAWTIPEIFFAGLAVLAIGFVISV